MQYLLGIDIGTSGTKTAAFDTAGHLIASHTADYPLFQPQNGYAEQNPEDWWRAVVTGTKSVLSQLGSSAKIAGIGLSGQMHSLVMLNQDGCVLRPAILWCDQRTGAECEEITSLVGCDRLLQITANPALTGFTASKILWVRKHEPHIYENCAHILLPKDYIRYKLTGEFATEVSDASGMQLLDVGRRAWSDEVLEKLSINKALLGKVYESPEVTGTVSPAAAAQTGLRAGIPVVGGGGDNAASAVGVGVVREGEAFVSLGTSGVVFAHMDSLRVDLPGRVHTFCCAVPGAWHAMGVTQAAGLSRQWFQTVFCGDDAREAEQTGRKLYDILDEKIAQSPIGSNRLLYLPYLMGERTPHLDPDARGVFFGLSAMHTRHDLLRAVLEGVSFSLRDCLEVLRTMGIDPQTLIACGGGANSPLWRQMLSDIFTRRLLRSTSQEGAALGAAILAGVGAGVYTDVHEGCSTAVSYEQQTDFNSQNSKKYEQYYQLYQELYPALAASYKKLNSLQ